MKRKLCHIGLLLLMLACCSVNAIGLEFKAGSYYFDNSKLKFNKVSFVAGNDTITHVLEMVPDTINSQWFNTTLPDDIVDLTGFCFINSDKEQGAYNQGLQDFLNECGTTETTFRQTKVRNSIGREPQHLIGWVFCPLNDFEISDGYWRPQDSYNVEPSRTVPLIYINTQNSVTIADKENYIDGTFWLDNCGIEGYAPLGSEASPLTIQIKGRGNWTWVNMYKKPYKLKFATKQSPLGLDNSKHFILMPNAVDWSGYLRNETAFELSRQLGMPYTTRQLPVEVVLNGEYEGLYFLCEKIRVESGRVDIMEQQDNDHNPYNVSGGWLLENDWEGPLVNVQYEGNDPNNHYYGWSSKSPEAISPQQYNCINPLLKHIDECIYASDKTDNSWENYIDVNYLARFYVIIEVMDGIENFTRSLFMYKDWGEDSKFIFGPVWDFDCSYQIQTCDHFVYDYESEFKPLNLWIRELAKFPHFQQVIRQVWKEFKANNVLDKINEHASQWRSLLVDAEYNDKMRWRTYSSMHSQDAPTDYLNLISRKVAWLNQQWRVPVGDVNCDGEVTSFDVTAIYNYLLNGDETFVSTCDVDGDGAITSHDITKIYDIILNGGFPPLPH